MVDEEILKKDAVAVLDATIPGFTPARVLFTTIGHLFGQPDLGVAIAASNEELLHDLSMRMSRLEGRVDSQMSPEQGYEVALNAFFEARRTTSPDKRRLLLDAMEACLSKTEFSLVKRKLFMRLVSRLEMEHVQLLGLMGSLSWVIADGYKSVLVEMETEHPADAILDGLLPISKFDMDSAELVPGWIVPSKVTELYGIPSALFLELHQHGLTSVREERYCLSILGAELLMFMGTDAEEPIAGAPSNSKGEK